MSNQIKIVIADDNPNICKLLLNHLQSQQNFYVVGIASNGFDAWEFIQAHEPDLVILDLVMPKLDGLEVIERINARLSEKRPKIIMLTAFGQETLTHQVMSLGVDYFILKPFDFELLTKRIRSLAENTLPSSSNNQFSSSTPVLTGKGLGLKRNIDVEITNIMHQIGIPAHVKGHQYIRDAISMVIEDVSLLGAVTTELYPTIAKKRNAASTGVERGIRHAIELAWERGRSETLEQIFGYSMNTERQKPTNSKFIALLADRLRIMSSAS